MTSDRFKVRVMLLTLISVFLLSGCSGLGPNYNPTDKTLILANKAIQQNQSLKTCKGTGWLKVTTPDKSYRLRVAWAASLPDRLRMTLLSAGHPIETIIADGRQVKILSHTGNHAPRILNSPNPSLERLIFVPVTLRETIAFLAGRIPVKPFDSAVPMKSAGPEETMLRLERQWYGPVAHLSLNNNGDIVFFQPFNTREEPLYTVTLNDYRDLKGYRIPFNWSVTDPAGRTMVLDLSAYMADIPVKESAFNLTESR